MYSLHTFFAFFTILFAPENEQKWKVVLLPHIFKSPKIDSLRKIQPPKVGQKNHFINYSLLLDYIFRY